MFLEMQYNIMGSFEMIMNLLDVFQMRKIINESDAILPQQQESEAVMQLNLLIDLFVFFICVFYLCFLFVFFICVIYLIFECID